MRILKRHSQGAFRGSLFSVSQGLKIGAAIGVFLHGGRRPRRTCMAGAMSLVQYLYAIHLSGCISAPKEEEEEEKEGDRKRNISWVDK